MARGSAGSWEQRSLKAKWREAVIKLPDLKTSKIGQDSVYTPQFKVPKTVNLRKAPDR